MITETEARKYNLFRYNELSSEAAKMARDRFNWDFVNNKSFNYPDSRLLEILSKHWFDKDGSTFLGTY
jgi:hypothetical protein